mgnify:CR=1 FL=1
MLLMVLTLIFTACGKKEEKDEAIVNPVETSTAPSYEEETKKETKEAEPEESLMNMAKIRATELYDVVYKSGETIIKQVKDLS